MPKIISAQEAAALVKDGSSLMMGGFIGVGAPHSIIAALVNQGTNNLTVIGNDTATPDKGAGKLIVNKQIKHVIASHIGTNKETGQQMNSGDIQVTLVPQGTLAERIRAAGCGLGGVLTPTGVGTPVEADKQIIVLNDKKYLLEEALGAEIVFIKAHKADTKGNLIYRHMARNFNPIMDMAGVTVVAEVDEIVDVGEIQPDEVMTPGIFIDFLVQSEVSE